jgi:sugar phosphate permease
MHTTVRVSPIAAHFLLRSRLEQSLIAGGGLLFASPFLLVGLSTLFLAHDSASGMMLGVAAFCALLFGRLGIMLGTWAANFVALLRERRKRIERGELA